MAYQFSGFFDSTPDDERSYSETELSRGFRIMSPEGVKTLGDNLKVRSGSGFNVRVDYGAAMVHGYPYELIDDGGDALYLDLVVPTVYSRTDRIVLRLDLNAGARHIQLAVLQGTEMVESPPALTRTDTVYEISLAQIRAYPGPTPTITITDERSDDTVCGVLEWQSADRIPARWPGEETSDGSNTTVVQAVLNTIHPYGSILMTTVPDNPSTYMGFGVWEPWGAGRVPVGVNTGDSDFNTAEKIGGAKTHTNELTNAGYAKMHIRAGTSEQMMFDMANNVPEYTTGYTLTPGNTLTVASNTVNRGIRLAGATGDGSSLQPYITCYMWKRIA